MQRKLAKKLTNTIEHQLEEDDGEHGHPTSFRRRGSLISNPVALNDEDGEDEPQQAQGPDRHYDPSNPFTYYDQPQSLGSMSTERISRAPEPHIRHPSPSTRIGALVQRTHSPIAQKTPQMDPWAAPEELEGDDDDEYETENGEEDDLESEYSSISSFRPSQTDNFRPNTKQEKKSSQILARKKRSGSQSQSQKKSQSGKKSSSASKKGSKGKDNNYQGSDGRRSRGGFILF